ncbi:hypothetical protein [Paraclostridium sp. AKS81]|uniref:hypothetical protein n=1 Tax=Paraclostridium sp. AKS81 TaxID=2876117 RepID=UPI0021E065D8|nr:hypothetical protein [Paraclostridium sp. AKS81]MCU9811305.1 hypothetical protein [Paraclostridium sp. AKS81]
MYFSIILKGFNNHVLNPSFPYTINQNNQYPIAANIPKISFFVVLDTDINENKIVFITPNINSIAYDILRPSLLCISPEIFLNFLLR